MSSEAPIDLNYVLLAVNEWGMARTAFLDETDPMSSPAKFDRLAKAEATLHMLARRLPELRFPVEAP